MFHCEASVEVLQLKEDPLILLVELEQTIFHPQGGGRETNIFCNMGLKIGETLLLRELGYPIFRQARDLEAPKKVFGDLSTGKHVSIHNPTFLSTCLFQHDM